VRGPDRDIIPFSLLVMTEPKPNETGVIYTAPGAANTTPKVKAKNRAKINPKGHILNSARHPYLWATNLWVSSCPMNPVPRVNKEIIKFFTNNPRLLIVNPPDMDMEKANPSASHAIKRC